MTGASGQLGSEIRTNADRKARYFFTGTDVLDTTQVGEIRSFIRQNHIGLIMNRAAYTNVDKAEDDTAVTKSINHAAVAHLATVCTEVSVPPIHIPTNCVFGGNGNTPCTEAGNTCSLGVHGRTKSAGEQATQQAGIEHLIIRTAQLYPLQFSHNFVKTIQRLSHERNELETIFDRVGSPTNTADLATLVVYAIENALYKGKHEVYHFSDEGVCSQYDFAAEIVAQAGNAHKALPCRPSEFPSKVARPPYSVLDKTKLKTDFVYEVKYWRKALIDS